jgi:hypothetical protein
MRKTNVSGLAVLVLLAFSAQLRAHHGQAGVYDEKKIVKVEGVVKQFSWRNPHSAVFIEGSSDVGEKGTFILEIGAPAALLNDYGMTKKTFQPGDRVVISMHPSFANPTSGKGMQNHFFVNGVEFLSKNGRE